MKIKNYTSEVPAHTTIQRIQSKLVDAKVHGIGMEYDGGTVSAITFTVVLDGRSNTVRLDPRIKDVQDALWKQYAAETSASYRRKGVADFRQQAERTAWRLLQDWIEVELSRVALRQGEFEEIFLAHLWDGKQTSYQFLKQGGFKALLPERSSEAL